MAPASGRYREIMTAQIFHIATRGDWRAAVIRGSYDTSTRGRTLAEEGFIHASTREQVQPVFDRYYADAGEPLVLLTIDVDKLTAPVRDEQVGDTTYPHIYGPINTEAVVEVQLLDASGGVG